MANINNLNDTETPLEGFNPDAEGKSNNGEYRGNIPPKGIYMVSCELKPIYGAEDTWTLRTFDGGSYFVASVTGHIQEPGSDYDRRLVFLNKFSTRVREDGTSQVGDFIKAAGYTNELKNITSHEAMCQLATQIAETAIPVRVSVNWKATKGWVDGENDERGAFQVDYFGMENFPKNEDGSGYRPFVMGTIDGEEVEVRATPIITKFLAQQNGQAATA